MDRTISFLQHARRHYPEHRDRPLEEIYEDQWFFDVFICNYQVKMFSMTPEEALMTRKVTAPDDTARGYFQRLGVPVTEQITVDDARLDAARRALATVNVLGVTDRFNNFVAALVDRYGWRVQPTGPRNTSEHLTVPPAFRRRVERDQAADSELYEYARRLAP